MFFVQISALFCFLKIKSTGSRSAYTAKLKSRLIDVFSVFSFNDTVFSILQDLKTHPHSKLYDVFEAIFDPAFKAIFNTSMETIYLFYSRKQLQLIFLSNDPSS